MKELSTEEKARRYDEAIERAKAIYYQGSYKPDTAATIAETLQNIFPALKESEDERIRQKLLFLCYSWRNNEQVNIPDREEVEKTISWLEKQNQNLEKLKLEKGKWYFCIEDYHPRADCTDFYQGEKYRCEKDGVMGVWCIKNPEKYFRECKTPTYADSDSVRIQSIIQVLEYARSLSAYNQFGKDDITKDIAWIEKQGEHANFLSNIQVGDKVTRNEDGVLVNLSQLNRVAKKQGEQKPCMIQWKGDNLKEVIGFTGKDKNFDKWFKSFEEYEKYVHEHNDIFKLFNEDGSHYEVPIGAWIVKTPDGRNVASKSVFKQKPTDKVEQKFKEE